MYVGTNFQMATNKVFTIYVPFLNSKLYYVANEEWSFEITEARYFSCVLEALLRIERLRNYEQHALWLHSINPDDLKIESSQQETQSFIHLHYPS